MNSLNLCLSGNVFISLLSRLVLLYIEFSVGSVSLLAVWLRHLTACWPPVFLMRSQLLILLRFLTLYTGSFYLADFKIFFFFCLHFAADCRCGFEFILEICVTLWMCTVFIRFGWFSAIMFSNIFVLLLLSPVKVKVAQSCPTFGDPMDYTVHGVLQAKILEWVAFPFSRESSQPRDRTQVLLHYRQILYQLNHKGSPLGLPLYICWCVLMVSQWFLRLHSFFIHKGWDKKRMCSFLSYSTLSPVKSQVYDRYKHVIISSYISL